jgi:Secretion system C-terminal sorting domain
MKQILYLFLALVFSQKTFAQIPDPCTGAGATQPISTASPCNCSEAQSGTTCSNTIYTAQTLADGDIHNYLLMQSTYARPTIPALWQDVRGDNMMVNGVFKHEFSVRITTGPLTTQIALINICQVKSTCDATCQDYKIIALSGTCGNNDLTPTLITSTLDPTIKYRQYNVSPGTTYIVSRQIFFNGTDLGCAPSWLGADGLNVGPQIASQHWFIWGNGQIVLPIQNLQAGAKQLHNTVVVQWSTDNEFNSSKFIVEKSTNGINFIPIGEKLAAGNSYTQSNYWLEDNTPSAQNFYRIKSLDRDGRFTYSKVARLDLKANDNTSLIVAPNPAKENINIIFNSAQAANVPYRIISTNGETLQKGSLYIAKGTNKISKDISLLNPGMYFLQIQSGNEVLHAKIIKQ